MLPVWPLSHAVHLPCLGPYYGLCIQLFGHIRSERWHTNFCRDYSFHPIGMCEGRYTGWSAGGRSVSPKNLRKFVHPFAISCVQSFL